MTALDDTKKWQSGESQQVQPRISEISCRHMHPIISATESFRTLPCRQGKILAPNFCLRKICRTPLLSVNAHKTTPVGNNDTHIISRISGVPPFERQFQNSQQIQLIPICPRPTLIKVCTNNLFAKFQSYQSWRFWCLNLCLRYNVHSMLLYSMSDIIYKSQIGYHSACL